MKSLQNKYFFPACILVTVIILLLALTIFSPDNIKNDVVKPEKSNIPLAERTATVLPAAQITSTPTNEIVVASPTINPVTVSVENQIIHQKVLIQDALGIPVKKGTITIGSKIQKFENGETGVDILSHSEKQEIVASAIGYASSTVTIDTPSDQPAQIHLDYVCDFVIKVLSDFKTKKPAENAKVILRKQRDLIRPITGQIEMPLLFIKGENKKYKIQRKNDAVIIVQDEPADDSPENAIKSVSTRWSGFNIEHFYQGSDLSSSLSAISPLLRLWDTLAVISMLNNEGPENFHIIFNDETSTLDALFDIDFKSGSEWSLETQTDANGIAIFEKIPSGMYSAQAFKDNERSAVVTLLPACNKSVTFLSSTATVSVNVAKTGSQIKDLSTIAGAVITLKCLDPNSSAILTKPTDKVGFAYFEKVPYGKYTLTAKPPAETNLPEKSLEVNLTDYQNQYFIKYETMDGMRLAGKVIRADTNEPVPGYPLVLFRKTDPIGVFNTVVSEQDGSFVFDKVINGKYSLSYNGSADNINFLPEGEYLVPPGNFVKGQPIVVNDQNQENIIYAVLPITKTTLKGIVVDENGVPQKNAILGAEKISFSNKESISKPDGTFELSFVTTSTNSEIKDTLLAEVYEPREEEKNTPVMSADGNFFSFAATSYSSKEGELSDSLLKSKGETPFHCKIGDTVEGIKIIVSENNMGVVHGKIIAKPEPKTRDVHFMQNGNFVKGAVNPDQTFTLKGLVPGKFRIDIQPDQEYIKTEKYGDRPITRHCLRNKEFVFPEDQKTMQCEVEIFEAGQICGYLYDKNNDPMEGILVICLAGDEKNPDSYGGTNTEKNGFFWVWGLRKDLPHQLRFEKNFNEKSPVIMDNLKTDGPEVIIKLK